ncbi:hypothetical protein HMPREF3038_00937 [Akkermansia sp. KLE1797]|nr:hypothetical protein HMPREF3038_00937 [Akkermansia sp. KLE1797]KZA04808.1 hypothetical protein HMPREF1326_01385 [Akkermansia sp. KLE1605]
MIGNKRSYFFMSSFFDFFWKLRFFNICSFYLRCVWFLTFFARPT